MSNTEYMTADVLKTEDGDYAIDIPFDEFPEAVRERLLSSIEQKGGSVNLPFEMLEGGGIKIDFSQIWPLDQ